MAIILLGVHELSGLLNMIGCLSTDRACSESQPMHSCIACHVLELDACKLLANCIMVNSL